MITALLVVGILVSLIVVHGERGDRRYNGDMRKRTEKIYHYDVVFDPNGGGYTVTVPALPEIVTEGSNLREARAMAKDAILCVLEAALKEGKIVHPAKRAGVRRENVTVSV